MPMLKRLSLVGIFAATALIGVGYASAFAPGGAPAWAPWTLAIGTPLVLVSAMVMGAARDGRLGPLLLPFLALFGMLAGGFALLLALKPTDAAEPTLVLGLPPRAALVLYGIGLGPALIVPVAYALTFERMTLSRETLERVRRAGRDAAGERGTDPLGSGVEA